MNEALERLAAQIELQALAGQALQAAEYAAYAAVYSGGGHGAVADPASFAPERDWQLECLARLARAA